MDVLSEMLCERGRIILCLNQFKFWKQSDLKSGEEKWPCEDKKCLAVLKTIGSTNNCTLTFQRTLHNHEAIIKNLLNRQILSTGAIQKTTENNFEVPKKIIINNNVDIMYLYFL